MKRLWIIAIVIFVFGTVCVSYAGQSPQAEEVEQYIDTLRRRIESFYEIEINEVLRRQEGLLRHIEVADKTPFASMPDQADLAREVLRLSNFQTEDNLRREDISRFSGKYGIRQRLVFAPRDFASARTSLAQVESRGVDQAQWQILNLQQKRDYALNVRLPQLKRQLLVDEAAEPEVINKLTGIIYSPESPVAVIGGKIVKTGQIVANHKVVAIHKESVELKKDGNVLTLKPGYSL